MSVVLLTYRAGDTFSYATVQALTLPRSAWTATMSLVDQSKPNLPPIAGVQVAVVALNVNALDATKTDYQVVLLAASSVTAAWPKGNANLTGTISFTDSLGNRTSSYDFPVRGR